jgi:hypothetical protein
MRTAITTRFINTLIKNILMKFGEVNDEQNKTGFLTAPLISASRLDRRSGRRCHVRTDDHQAQPDEMGMASVRQQGECPKAGVRKKPQAGQVQGRARVVSSIGRAGIALTIRVAVASRPEGILYPTFSNARLGQSCFAKPANSDFGVSCQNTVTAPIAPAHCRIG